MDVDDDPIEIVLAEEGDLEQLVELMEAHAAFERAAIAREGLEARLAVEFFGASRRAWALVAKRRDGRLLGYATYAAEFGSWSGREYLHLDTLFVTEEARGAGIGRRLLDVVVDAARGGGFSDVQWQTPTWNTDAQRFYERFGATRAEKVRYVFALDERCSSSPDAGALRSSVPITRAKVRDLLGSLDRAWLSREVRAVARSFAPGGRYEPSVTAPTVEHLEESIARMLDHDDTADVRLDEVHISGSTATRRWTYASPEAGEEVHGIDLFVVGLDGVLIKDAYRKMPDRVSRSDVDPLVHETHDGSPTGGVQ